MQIKETAVFRCPIDVLFSYIEEPEKQKLWMKGLLANESTSRGVNSTFRMKIQEGRKVAEYDGEVTAYEKPHRLEVVFWGGNFPKDLKMRVDYRLHESEGKTTLDYTCTMEAAKVSLFMRLMLILCKVFGRMQVRSFLKTLRHQVEVPAQAA